jgi:3-deoxy-D-manno-octulosonic-acid transferase
MSWVANLLYLLAGVVYLPILAYQMIFRGKNRRGWSERFGTVPRRAPGKPRIWLHAVSLGEMNATRQLVAQLEAAWPDLEVVLSTTTDTGFARGVTLYGRERIFRYPLDFSWVVRRALDRTRPTMIVLIELEVWPNLIRAARRRGIPVCVVNGRLTERSAGRFSLLGGAGRAMFGGLTWVGAQEEAIAERFQRVGVPADRVEVTSSLKWDTAEVADHIAGAADMGRALGLGGGRPIWVCGSTGPGEEAILLQAYRNLCDEPGVVARNMQASTCAEGGLVRSPGAPAELAVGQEVATDRLAVDSAGDRPGSALPPVLVLVPRKPERFAEVGRLIESTGLDCIRRSARPDGVAAPPVPHDAVVLADTMGELRKLYSLADIVFVGRTLVPLGGSDPMEVAALGKPVLVGPHTGNFALPVQVLQEGGGLQQVADVVELETAVRALLRDRPARQHMGEQARQVVLRQQGATARTVARLVEMFPAS